MIYFGGLGRAPIILMTTLYYNLIQDLSIRHKTGDRAQRQFTQILLSDGGQTKPAGKKNRGGKIRQKIWVGTIAQALNSPSIRHCSCAAEIFYFRLIRIHSNARHSIFQLHHAVHNMS